MNVTGEKRNRRIIWWSLCVLYIAVTFASLGAMPAMWNDINAFFDGRGVMAQYAVYAISGLSILCYMLFMKKEKRVSRYLIFLGFVVIFFIMIQFEKNPGEKIHMGQYGLFGILVYHALKIDFDGFGNALYVVGAAICIVAGAVDEVIQGILPNRYFTWHDVFINGLSGILALLIIRFNILERQP